MKQCLFCKNEIENPIAIFCDSSCYKNARKNGHRKHSEETKNKIAIGNTGQVFSAERCKAISAANQKKITDEQLEYLISLWEKRYLNPLVILELTGIGQRVYTRLKKEYCKFEQFKFSPSDWYPSDWELLIELGNQNIWYGEIAKKLSRKKGQIRYLLLKLGIKPVTKNPSAWHGISSKIELLVLKWLDDENYKVKPQFSLGKFFFDAHVENSNILIEVNGDYWHCNPRVYTNGAINELQKNAIRRDFAKKSCALKNGFTQITVWENDINTNPIEAKEKFLIKVRELYERNNDC